MKRHILVLALTFSVAASFACASTRDGVPGGNAVAGSNGVPRGWVYVSDVDAGFEATFPVAPETSRTVVETDSGPVEITSIAAEVEDVAFLVAANPIFVDVMNDVGIEGLLDNVRDGALEAVGGRLVGQRGFMREGNPARHIVASIDEGGLMYEATLIIVQRGDDDAKLYQVVVVSPKNVDNARDRLHFVNSFRPL